MFWLEPVLHFLYKLTMNFDYSLCVITTCMLRCSMLNLTFTEFTTEWAVKPLTTVLPPHRRTHGGSTKTTSHNILWLFAHWQGLLQAVHTSTLKAQLYIFTETMTLNGLGFICRYGFTSIDHHFRDYRIRRVENWPLQHFVLPEGWPVLRVADGWEGQSDLHRARSMRWSGWLKDSHYL